MKMWKSLQCRTGRGILWAPSVLILFCLLFLHGGTRSGAIDQGIATEFSHELNQIRGIIGYLEGREQVPSFSEAQRDQVRALAEQLEASSLLLEASLEDSESTVTQMGGLALQRQRQMVERFRTTTETVRELTDRLLGESRGPVESEGGTEALGEEESRSLTQLLDDLRTLLGESSDVRGDFIYGTTPYRHLNLSSRTPNAAPAIVPAYESPTQAFLQSDLSSTLAAEIDVEIALLAESLGWNPTRIYDWVKQNITTEWYWGCMKGAKETLRQRSGNDADQAALLVALLRASNFPARFVRGVIEFFPDLSVAQSLTGVGDPSRLPDFFRKAGIPYQTVISGGAVSNIHIERIWVETLVPFENFHGTVADETGKRWVALDTAFKTAGYSQNDPVDVFPALDLAELRSSYLSTAQNETPMEVLRERVEEYLGIALPTLAYDDLLLIRDQISEPLNLLPASLQFTTVKVTEEYGALPTELLHQMRLVASGDSNTPIFDVTLPTVRLSNQQIAIDYEPDTVEDHQTINEFGGLDTTPAYLVHLRPSLRIGDEVIELGGDGLLAGTEFSLETRLISPSGKQSFVNRLVTGGFAIIGLVAQQAVTPGSVDESEQDAWRLLYEESIAYIDRWNQAEDELASLLQMVPIRPFPTLVTLGGVSEVTYLLNTPQDLEWKGAFVDADLRVIELVPRGASDDFLDRQRSFMQLSALEGSILENRILEDDFGVESISTAKLFGIANDQSIPLLTLDAGNVETELAALPFSELVKSDIADAITQGHIVTVPDSNITYQDWTGVGYRKENPTTGEAGYMLSGVIAGGMSTGPWSARLEGIMKAPQSGPPNQDPTAATQIFKIAKTDRQRGTVDKNLDNELKVVVLDAKGKPVVGAEVQFSVVAGGATIVGNSGLAATDGKGVAKVELKLGKKTNNNGTFVAPKPGEKHWQLVDNNLIQATLATNGAATAFSAYAFPDNPTRMVRGVGHGDTERVLRYGGLLSVRIEDQFENPVANVPVAFVAQTPTLPANYACQVPKEMLLMEIDSPCIEANLLPLYDECPSAGQQLVVGSDHTGYATIATIMGGVNLAQYDVVASTQNPNLSETLTKNTFAAACTVELNIGITVPADEFGVSILSGEAGRAMPLRVRLLKEQQESLCSEVNPELGAFVQIGGRIAQSIGNGIYEVQYVPGLGHNSVTVHASIPSPDPQLDNNCIQRSTTFSVVGLSVGLALGPDPIIDLDPLGFTDKKYVLTANWTPIDYLPANADIHLFRDDKLYGAFNINRKLEPTSRLNLIKGFWFDPRFEQGYTAQVVLNYGGEWQGHKFEARSRPISLLGLYADDRVKIVTRVDRINGDVCGGTQPLNFSLGRPADVTVEVNGAPIQQTIGNQQVLMVDQPYPAGPHEILFDRSMVPSPGEHDFKITAVFADDPDRTPRSVTGTIIHDLTIDSFLPVGHTFVRGVNLNTGAVSLSRKDFSITAVGPSLSFSRSYGSSGSRSSGVMGAGWVHSFQSHIVKDDCGHFIVVGGEGSGIRFKNPTMGPGGTEYEPEKGYHGRLIQINPTTFDFYTKGRTRYQYVQSPDSENPNQYTLRFIEDPNENQLLLSYQSAAPFNLTEVTDASGRKLKFEYAPFGKIPEDRLVRVTGPLGLQLEYQYDEFGNLTKAKRGPKVESYQYSITHLLDKHNLLEVTDPDGDVTKYGYFAASDTITGYPQNFDWNRDIVLVAEKYEFAKFVTEGFGTSVAATTQFKYDVVARTRTVTNPKGDDSVYTLNEYGSVIELEDPLSNITKTKWAIDVGIDDVYVVETTDPNQNVTQFKYDSNGNLTETEDALMHSSTVQYDLDLNLPLVTIDARMKETHFSYDGKGNVLTETDAENGAKTNVYNGDGTRQSVRDARGNLTTFGYDTYGNLTAINQQGAGAITFVYDARGRMLRRTDGRNHSTEYVYDDLDRVTEVRDHLGNKTSYTYSHGGLKISETNPRGKGTSFRYDALKRITRITDAAGKTIKYRYDLNGNMINETNKRGKGTTYFYDKGDRLTRIENADGDEMSIGYDAVGNKTSVTDYNNHSTTFIYDKMNRLERVVDAASQTTTYGYDEVGNRISVTTPKAGQVTTYMYDGVNRLEKIIDARSKETIYGYDGNGNLTSVKDRNGNVTTYKYDQANRLTDVVDANQKSIIYGYDAVGNRTSVTDKNGNATSYVFDAVNRVVRVTAPGTQPIGYEYDANGNVKELTDAIGTKFTHKYDDLDRLEKVEFNNPNVGEKLSVSYTYDENGNRLTTTNARSHTTTFTYDALDRLETTKDARNQVVVFTYDAMGNKTKEIDKRQIVTEWGYDILDRLTSVKRDGKQISGFGYDEVGNKTSEKDANLNETTFMFDVVNRLESVTAGGVVTTLYGYDDEGNRTSETNPEGHDTFFGYDALNRLTSITDAESNFTEFRYDAEGNRTRVIPPKGNQFATAFEYDSNNRLKKVIDPLSNETEFFYDDNGNVLEQRFPGNAADITFRYDSLNRLIRETHDGLVTEYEYDANGNRTLWKDAKGQSVGFSYDKLARLSEKTYPAPNTAVFPYLQRVQYGYDANNNLINVEESLVTQGGPPVSKTTDMGYDKFDRVQTVTDRHQKTVVYGYDTAGNRVSVTDSDNKVSSFVYDTLNRVQSVTTEAGLTQYSYFPDSLPSGIQYPNNTQVDFIYDKANRVKDIRNTGPAGLISRHEFGYDGNGNPTFMKETQGGIPETTTYGYDQADRLRNVSYPIDANYPNGRNVTYGYDAVSNRTSELEEDRFGTVLADRSYTYNARNRLTQVKDLLTSAQTFYGYDNNGNTILRNSADGTVTEFHYDVRDHLRRISEGVRNIASFEYDFQGMRVVKQVRDVETRYVYDQRSVLVETDETGATIAKYDYADRLISLTHRDQGTQFYHFGALDSTSNLTDISGTVLASYKYDVWGNPRETTGTSYNPKTFNGKEYDAESGLYYFGARFYDPQTARFLTQDPYRGEINQPPSLHRYLYAYANPTRNIDIGGFKTSRFSSFMQHLRFAGEAISESMNSVGAEIKKRVESTVQESVFAAADAGQFAYKALKYSVTGEFEKTRPASDLGKAIASGVSAKDVLVAAGKAIINKPGKIIDAFASGDPDRIRDEFLDISSLATSIAVGGVTSKIGAFAKRTLRSAATSGGKSVVAGLSKASAAGRKLAAKVERTFDKLSDGFQKARSRSLDRSAIRKGSRPASDSVEFGTAPKQLPPGPAPRALIGPAGDPGGLSIRRALPEGPSPKAPLSPKGGTTGSIPNRAQSSGSSVTDSGQLARFDPRFAATQVLENGQVSLTRLKSLVPKGTPNTFRPSPNIEFGQKYRFEVNGTRMEVKFRSRDLNAAARFPESASGKQWTAQIKVGNKLLGGDGQFYRRPSNLTHIPIVELPK